MIMDGVFLFVAWVYLWRVGALDWGTSAKLEQWRQPHSRGMAEEQREPGV